MNIIHFSYILKSEKVVRNIYIYIYSVKMCQSQTLDKVLDFAVQIHYDV